MINFLLEKNLLPDPLLRLGIRRLLAQRIREETERTPELQRRRLLRMVDELKTLPIAIDTAAANAQHYEVPTAFYQLCLGKRLKYSGCLYPSGRETLDAAEENMLSLYTERAQLADGQDILELGCGWGSLSLWLAEKFPHSRITGVSNSRTQKEFIDAEARRRRLANLTILTCNMTEFDPAACAYDRVVSVEMFEHMKNYQRLLANIARWLRPGGLLFVHIFTHRTFAYHFVARDETDWMSRHFFTGGIMPSHDLLSHFQEDLTLTSDWVVNGRNYQQTAEHWLQNMDRHKAEILPILAATYGESEKGKWWVYWRVFFLACAELWGWRDGTEWQVSHYLFRQPGP